MIIETGHYAFTFAIFLSMAQIFIPFAPKKKKATWKKLSITVSLIIFCLMFLSFSAYIRAFLISDFSMLPVYGNSDISFETYQKIFSAFSCRQGIIISWLLIQSAVTAVFFFTNMEMPFRKLSINVSIQSTVFFLTGIITVFSFNPFTRIYPVPLEGLGNNPEYFSNSFFLAFVLSVMASACFLPVFSITAVPASENIKTAFYRKTKKLIITGWSFLTFAIGCIAYWKYSSFDAGIWWKWGIQERFMFGAWLLCGSSILMTLPKMTKKARKTSENLLLLIFPLCFLGAINMNLSFENSYIYNCLFVLPFFIFSLWKTKQDKLFSFIKNIPVHIPVLWITAFVFIFSDFSGQTYSHISITAFIVLVYTVIFTPSETWNHKDFLETYFFQRISIALFAIIFGTVLIYGGFEAKSFSAAILSASAICLFSGILIKFTDGNIKKLYKKKTYISFLTVSFGIAILATGISISSLLFSKNVFSVSEKESFYIDDKEITITGTEIKRALDSSTFITGIEIQNKKTQPVSIQAEKIYLHKKNTVIEKAAFYSGFMNDTLIAVETPDSLGKYKITVIDIPFMFFIWLGFIITGLSAFLLLPKKRRKE